ncbi:MAG: hypothetical protein A2W31_10605 [Planctomycetes bacterium RBG_16_64_10]|nr:MAG: hypothetical protein A2W31_10605 [Planctomycetes bacterium RBG_16_64_10]
MSQALAPLDLEPVKACFAELQAQQGELERYFADSFRELESLRADLGQFHEELRIQRSELERGRRDLEATARELEQQQSSQLAALQEKYEAAQAELDRLRQQPDESRLAREAVLERQIDQLQNECNRFESESEVARTRVAELTATIEDLSQADRDHNTVDETLCDARQRLEIAAQEMSSKEAQISKLEQERDDLEAELDSVRSRAAELSDTLDQIKRESIEERAEWSAELKQMRRVLERQTDLLTPRPSSRLAVAAPTATMPMTTAGSAASAQSAADPVLGTVMAQFEKIRQERAQRRLKRGIESA